MTTQTTRRALVAGAAMLPALAVPATASAAPSTTLPPDLVTRFMIVRAWYLDFNRREQVYSDEVGRRFYAATGVTGEQFHEMSYGERRESGLDAAHSKVINEVELEEAYETECDDLHDERWALAEAMMAQTPRTITDLAYQTEAFLIADLEFISGEPKDGGDWMIRTLLHHIQTLGAVPPPDFGSVQIDISRAEEEDDDSEA